MDEMPKNDRQKFFAVMVWVALIGAAIILVIDYQIKHSLLDLAKQVQGDLHRLEGHNRGRYSGGSVPGTPDPDSVLSGNGDSDGAWLEMAPVDRSGKASVPARDSSGRFAKREAGDRDSGIPQDDSVGAEQ